MQSSAKPLPTTSRARSASPAEQAKLQMASHEQRLDAAVDTLVDEWADVIPGLDRDVRAIAARIARIDDRLRAGVGKILDQHDLSDNEFRLLAGLMRSGAPYRCAPSDLAGRYVPVTSGGLTGVARRLETRGLIRRCAHPSDQRSMLIELTAPGKELAMAAMEQFAAVESALMNGLSASARANGNAFLRKLMLSIEMTLT